jgi:Protein of unknown function, DUF255
VWYHWCHVVDEGTHQDPKLIQLIRSQYVPSGSTKNSRLDLANRYEDYGWLVTIVFGADEGEIVKHRDYIPARQNCIHAASDFQ